MTSSLRERQMDSLRKTAAPGGTEEDARRTNAELDKRQGAMRRAMEQAKPRPKGAPRRGR